METEACLRVFAVIKISTIPEGGARGREERERVGEKRRGGEAKVGGREGNRREGVHGCEGG